jgi:MATE family multidrug resistance protein
MLGLSFFIGLNGALETLCSQACGNGELKLCGIYLNRGRFVLFVVMIPIVITLSYAEVILVGIGQNPVTAAYAQEYIFAYLPGLFIMGLFDGHRRFLSSLGRSKDPLAF